MYFLTAVQNFAVKMAFPTNFTKSLEYSTGVESLVQQQFVHTHWVGIGVTMFDELSQQLVTADQVKQLLKQDISDEDFHVLYRKLSVPNELVPFFGLKRPNVKIASPNKS